MDQSHDLNITPRVAPQRPAPPRQTTPRWVLILVAGLVLALLVGWMEAVPAGLLGKADAIGYAVCHRIDGRSFHLGERAFPLCVRCSGMYLGALVGLIYQFVARRRGGAYPPRRVLAVFVLFFMAFGLDGLNSYVQLLPLDLGVYAPQNWLRLLTGSGMGLVLAGVLFPAFNQTAWRDYDPTPAIPNLKSAAVMVGLTLAVDALVYSENPLLLYPLGVASAFTVLFILTITYSLIWMMLLRQTNLAARLNQLALPLMLGLGTGLLQVAALDAVRFWLTGTWSGFNFG